MYCERDGGLGQYTPEQMAEEGPGQYTYVSPWASAVPNQPPPPVIMASVTGQATPAPAEVPPPVSPTGAVPPPPSEPTVLPPPVMDTLLPLPSTPAGPAPGGEVANGAVWYSTMPVPGPGGGGGGPVSVSVGGNGAPVQRAGFGMVEAGIAAGLAFLLAQAWRRK